MNYETAKKLRDAGFKTNSGKVIMSPTQEKIFVRGGMVADTGYCDIPTLTELIKACIDRENYEFHLDKTKVYEGDPAFWTAWIDFYPGKQVQGEGYTPEIAVANLWLALHEKN